MDRATTAGCPTCRSGPTDRPATPTRPRPDGGAPSDGPASIDVPRPVDPQISRAWTWQPCGTIASEAADLAAVFDREGNIAVLGASGARLYDGSGALRAASSGPADFLVSAPDGAPLVGTIEPSGIVLKPIDSPTARFTFAPAPIAACGKTFAFSVDGDSPLHRRRREPPASGARRPRPSSEVSPRRMFRREVFRVDRGRRAGRRGHHTRGGGPDHRRGHARFQRARAGAPEARTDGPGLPFAGRRPPGDDRNIVGPRPHDRRPVDGESGEVLEPDPAFSPAGDLVLFGDGLFRTADGARLATVDDSSRLARAHEGASCSRPTDGAPSASSSGVPP